MDAKLCLAKNEAKLQDSEFPSELGNKTRIPPPYQGGGSKTANLNSIGV